MPLCTCSQTPYDERSDKSYTCAMCESPFREDTTRLLNTKMGFTVYLYKLPTRMQLDDQDYEVAFKTERGVATIHCRDAKLYSVAHEYLCAIYGDEDDDVGDALIWE
jgi:hypothetical protein